MPARPHRRALPAERPRRSTHRATCGPAGSFRHDGDVFLGYLDARHDGLRERLVDDGGLRRFVNVYLNDEDVRFLGGLSAPVSDGDTVTVLPAVAGGAS